MKLASRVARISDGVFDTRGWAIPWVPSVGRRPRCYEGAPSLETRHRNWQPLADVL